MDRAVRSAFGRIRNAISRAPHSGRTAPFKPKIGITGSFGRGNYGDELYVKNYQYWLGSWADLYLLAGRPQPHYLRDFGNRFVGMMDAIVLGGGDLLCPYRPNIDRDFIDQAYLRRPVHVAGIGVERNRDDIDPLAVDKWRRFLTHKNIRSITMRDPGSAEWIREHVRPSVAVESHPDLVCALPLPIATRTKGAPILGITTRHIKNPKEYRLLQEIAVDLMAKGWRVQHIIGGVGKHGAKDFENARQLEVPGKETVYSEDLDDISRALGACSLVLSMKLHTTLVSVMYGVPTICVNPVVKARAFMRSVGLEDLVLRSTDRKLVGIIDKGVRAPDQAEIQRLRREASDAMRALSQRLWLDYMNNLDKASRNMLPDMPQLPE